MDILVAHPFRHHAFNFFKGCLKIGADAKLVTPVYRKGIASILANVPGKFGTKIRGYECIGLDNSKVYAPSVWQIKRVLSVFGLYSSFEKKFDSYVALQLKNNIWNPKIIATLQDYMPETMSVAKEKGVRIISDQILNSSDRAMARIACHYKMLGHDYSINHNEENNTNIINNADLITAPSNYVREDLLNRSQGGNCMVIPYGVNTKLFGERNLVENKKEIVVIVRANTIRKGGHLLLWALEKSAVELKKNSSGKNIKFICLGKLESVLKSVANEIALPSGVEFIDGDFAHLEVPKLLARASLFVMPSLSEGMSLAVCEAMQSGLPIIATPYIGVDAFQSGVMGLEVEDSVDSLAFGLTEGFRRRDEWDKWGKAAKDVASQNDWAKYENGVAKVVAGVLDA